MKRNHRKYSSSDSLDCIIKYVVSNFGLTHFVQMKAEIMDGLKQEQEAERDELNNLLKLEQTEKLEELRKVS